MYREFDYENQTKEEKMKRKYEKVRIRDRYYSLLTKTSVEFIIGRLSPRWIVRKMITDEYCKGCIVEASLDLTTGRVVFSRHFGNSSPMYNHYIDLYRIDTQNGDPYDITEWFKDEDGDECLEEDKEDIIVDALDNDARNSIEAAMDEYKHGKEESQYYEEV